MLRATRRTCSVLFLLLLGCKPTNQTSPPAGNSASLVRAASAAPSASSAAAARANATAALTAPVTKSCPSPIPEQPVASVSMNLPADVCIPTGFGGLPIDFFDDFSWQSFLALVWPAQGGQRGVPDSEKDLGRDAPSVVFETFKADWEVFRPRGDAPAAWLEASPDNPCNLPTPQASDFLLASFSKFGNLGQAGFGALVGPVPAQNRTYTRYLTSFNKVEFDTILDKKLYLQDNLKNLVFSSDQAKNNPIDVKSSWIDMTGIAHPERYHTRQAWLFDPTTMTCAQKLVGLVGLHIVTKTPSRPQWIWSTFEQVDNVPQAEASPPLAYNDGSGTAMPPSNPIDFPPPAEPPTVFNVTRKKPIHDNTKQTNLKYRELAKSHGSGVWQFYQLVMTQWPVPGDKPENSGLPAFTFPGTGATTAFANTTLETFDQDRIRTGCMSCHDPAKARGDFVWSLLLNAFPSPLGETPAQPSLHAAAARPMSKELSSLKKLMQSRGK
jgi:hypothetical protein